MSFQFERVLRDGGTGNAEVVRDLECKIAEFVGTTYGLCVSSGTAALIAALWAVGVRPGDLVAVSALGPSMTGLAVTALGARPLFLDCATPSSFGISAAAATASIGAGAKAVVLVPMWGYWDEQPAVVQTFKNAGVPIVVDAAQAPFLRLTDGLCSVADVVCWSLHGRKPFKAGEGGVCLVSDRSLAQQILALRNFGQHATFTGRRLDPAGPFGARFGVNLKINALGAAWCLTQIEAAGHIRARLEGLRKAAVAAFTGTGLAWTEASQAAGVLEHGRYGFVAVCPTPATADALAKAVKAQGVEVDTLRYAYAPLYRTPSLAKHALCCPNAEQLTATAVACRLEAFTTVDQPGGIR